MPEIFELVLGRGNSRQRAHLKAASLKAHGDLFDPAPSVGSRQLHEKDVSVRNETLGDRGPLANNAGRVAADELDRSYLHFPQRTHRPAGLGQIIKIEKHGRTPTLVDFGPQRSA